MSLLLMIWYGFSWRGLVSMSDQIFSVGKYSTDIYSLLTTSFTKKYLTLQCLVFFKIDFFPFSIRRMVLWLSWNMMILSTVYPSPWIKYGVHNTVPIISLSPMILLSVEIRPLIFWFHEPLVMDPAPREITPPECVRQSLCVANYTSTHQFITERLFALRFRLTPNCRNILVTRWWSVQPLHWRRWRWW